MKGFSRRTGWDTGESGFAAAVREARASGREVVDLTLSNPTVCGFAYDAEGILGALADRAALVYDADPMGMRSAREAVCGYYADHGASVDPAQVMLTTSTSEAYGYLFRLLCDAGDEVLVARPGYPLFDFLADVTDVTVRSYPLFWDFGWWIDFAELERMIGPRTKAILVVNPANPTGHWTRLAERERLEELCARHGLALIVDEVFLDYPVTGEGGESFAKGKHGCLTFVLSGLSKVAGLPQMKVGWCVTFGPGADEALRRLEVVADTFLSMGAPAQRALPHWLAGRWGIQAQIRERVRENLGLVRGRHLPVESGWCVVLLLDGGGTAEDLLAETGVLVHPGSFYGLAGPGRVVASLLGPVKGFRRAMALLG
ncbi:Aspartate/methionine/tyrosine aminotransferase [Granulicella pectinivorans]|uniref:alanine transaminase n=1 Tax=Granulicella pectinivorans TaxID=474950 RepID=A0A1I6MKK5_9BACT|nr:pyridoxal phosphate-dependent aminotransferase [Granulicella pectinivorans]SFS16235.1 Aspartate/methionine/tyrosine aminotransferase [Granulicella pectinivorans]